MSQQPLNPENSVDDRYDDEIDLFELFQTIWDGKWLITAVTGIAGAISVAVALNLPVKYQVDMAIAPTASDSGGLSGLAAQYGGLASLAGISLPGGGGSETELLLEIMQSRAFLGEFIERHDLAPRLIAVNGYDSETGSESFDTEVYDPASGAWGIGKDGQSMEPTALGKIAALQEVLAVNQAKTAAQLALA